MGWRVLGAVEAVGPDGRVVALSDRQRAPAASLLARSGTVVPVDTLVERVWPDGPPADPVAALALWRGPAYAEFAETPVARFEVDPAVRGRRAAGHPGRPFRPARCPGPGPHRRGHRVLPIALRSVPAGAHVVRSTAVTGPRRCEDRGRGQDTRVD